MPLQLRIQGNLLLSCKGSFPTHTEHCPANQPLLSCVLSRSVVYDSLRPHGLYPTRFLCPWGFSRQEYWSGLPALLHRICPTQGRNPGPPHCRWILYHLSHWGSPWIQVAYSFSRVTFQCRNWTRSSWTASGFFTNWATREALFPHSQGYFYLSPAPASSCDDPNLSECDRILQINLPISFWLLRACFLVFMLSSLKGKRLWVKSICTFFLNHVLLKTFNFIVLPT